MAVDSILLRLLAHGEEGAEGPFDRVDTEEAFDLVDTEEADDVAEASRHIQACCNHLAGVERHWTHLYISELCAVGTMQYSKTTNISALSRTAALAS